MNQSSSIGASAQRPGIRAAMESVRYLCRVRSIERADEHRERFVGDLNRFRASPSGKGAPAIVSISLDRLIAELRSAVEFAAAPGEATAAETARVEQSIATLNSMYVASEQALSVGTMSPASFMPGAELVVSAAIVNVHEIAESYRNHQDAERSARTTHDERLRKEREELVREH